jgi:hypothetical protein
MSRAKKKPVEIEYFTYEYLLSNCLYDKEEIEIIDGLAGIMSYTVTNLNSIVGLYNSNCAVRIDNLNPTGFDIKTLEGYHRMTKEDVLIKGVEGQLYPCKINIFEKTYDIISI